jgi:hypothetical protein
VVRKMVNILVDFIPKILYNYPRFINYLSLNSQNYEKNISTESKKEKKNPWFFKAHANKNR